ncbi:MAG: hypothetical protein LIP06_09355 [Tannerellaceae bacterium]|nr:hypothetical protein [Tannerellaceae bacterium]
MNPFLNQFRTFDISPNECYIKLYPTCIVVEGYSRSVICDFQNSAYEYIPNSLYDFLTDEQTKTKTLDKLYQIYKQDQEILTEYIRFLLENNFAFLTKNPRIYKELYVHSALEEDFTNAIVEIGPQTKECAFRDYITILEDIGVYAIQLIIKGNFLLEPYLNRFLDSPVTSLDLVINYNLFKSLKVEDVKFRHPQLHNISVYEFPEGEEKNFSCKDVRLTYHMACYEELHRVCSDISKIPFITNLPFYFNGKVGNTCLYGKICITQAGKVKRCIFQNSDYGKIDDFIKYKKYQTEPFRSIAYITKEKIEKCSVCEHRYICMDCRLYSLNEQQLYAAPKYCNYDPYIGEWNTEK